MALEKVCTIIKVVAGKVIFNERAYEFFRRIVNVQYRLKEQFLFNRTRKAMLFKIMEDEVEQYRFEL